MMMGGLLLPQGCRNDPPAPPDDDPVVIPNETRSLDLDNDGRVDFLFSYLGIQTMDEPPSVISWSLNVNATGDHQVQYSTEQGALPLADGVVIDGAIGWSRENLSLASRVWQRGIGWSPSWSGPWVGVTPRNLGLRLYRQGAWRYGWVKLMVGTQDGRLRVVDSAYHPIANASIRAGFKP